MKNMVFYDYRARNLFAKLQLDVSRLVSTDAAKHAQEYQDAIDELDPERVVALGGPVAVAEVVQRQQRRRARLSGGADRRVGRARSRARCDECL